MIPVKDYWPKEISSSGGCPLIVSRYPDGEDRSFERLEHVIRSWKHTAEEHGLSVPFVKAFECVRCNNDEHEKCYLISYQNNEGNRYCLHGPVREVDAEYDVSEDVKEVALRICIEGSIAGTTERYVLHLSVERYPVITEEAHLVRIRQGSLAPQYRILREL